MSDDTSALSDTALSDTALFDTAAPRLSLDGAAELCREVYRLSGVVTELPSERDRNFLVRGDGPAAVLKLSHPAEDRGVVEMENAAMAHIAAVDPSLPIPRVLLTTAGEPITWTAGEDGRRQLTRLISVVPGEPVEGRRVSPELALAIGTATARLSIALRGFFHPAAGRSHVWDIRQVAGLAPHLDAVGDPDAAALVRRTMARCAPSLVATGRLPAQVEHADVTLTNVLTSGAELTGLIDFGDMHHTASVCDLAASLTSVLRSVAGDGPDAITTTAAAYLEGYQRLRPLLVEEAEVLGHLVQARLVATVLISAWRAKLHPDNTAYISQYDESSWPLLRVLDSDLDPAALMPRLTGTSRATVAQQPDPTLPERRAAVFGGPLSPLFYREPLHLVRGSGSYLYDADGRRFLDAYNNVPVLGHAHPAVAQAVSAQLRMLNINSRYLHANAVELAERLLSTVPAGAGLDTCIFVNSGTEAVDLAWRMATAATGRNGALVVEHGYHGISATVADFSTNEWPPGHDPHHVTTFAAPHRQPDGSPPSGVDARSRVVAAAQRLRARGHDPALLLVDPMFTSEGVLEPAADFLPELGQAARDAGALVLADEVQSGFGRCGPAMWSFAAGGLTPDLVTLGKPMGNGLPIGAVLTRSDIAGAMARDREFFSTFAGSPVAAAAALTVLDVLRDSQIPEQSVVVGDYLRAELRAVGADHHVVGEVRGRGLVAGVDIHADRGAGAGAGARQLTGADVRSRVLTGEIVESLRAAGVLVGSTGRDGSVLKIRPPLIWRTEQVDELVSALRGVLSRVAPR